jgi:hypothetical protein
MRGAFVMDVRGLRQKIESWLLESEIQVCNGPHQGGIAGWIDNDNQAEFVYPEIAGYFLTSMAFLRAIDPEKAGASVRRARLCFDWLCRQSKAGEVPLTRCYFRPCSTDWRNHVCFAFDLAMLIRGIGSAREFLDENKSRWLLKVYLDRLVACCEPKGTMKPWLALNGSLGQAVPLRWSTTSGPYQLKIASALSSLGDAMPEQVLHSCQHLVADWTKPRVHEIQGLHSFFYYLEGLVVMGWKEKSPHYWSQAARGYEQVMKNSPAGSGLTSQGNGCGCETRSDVLAQALRIGCLLKCQGFLKGNDWYDLMDQLTVALKAFISSSGGVAFRAPQEPRLCHWNAWSAMFTHQALEFYERLSNGNRLEEHLVRWLI